MEAAAARNRRPPLVLAAATGRHDVLTHLLRTADDDSSDDDGQQEREEAFLAAATRGHVRCLRALLDASPPAAVAELVAARKGYDWTALIWACVRGHAGCVAALLEAADPDAQVSAVDNNGSTALHLACVNGRADCVALLLRHSPDAQVAAVTDDDETALVCAAGGGHVACVQLLLVHSPQRQRLDDSLAWTAGLWLQLRGNDAADQRYRRCIELLLVHGAMLSPGAPPAQFALVRAVVCDLAARASLPAAADAAAAQAVHECRVRAGPMTTWAGRRGLPRGVCDRTAEEGGQDERRGAGRQGRLRISLGLGRHRPPGLVARFASRIQRAVGCSCASERELLRPLTPPAGPSVCHPSSGSSGDRLAGAACHTASR